MRVRRWLAVVAMISVVSSGCRHSCFRRGHCSTPANVPVRDTFPGNGTLPPQNLPPLPGTSSQFAPRPSVEVLTPETRAPNSNYWTPLPGEAPRTAPAPARKPGGPVATLDAPEVRGRITESDTNSGKPAVPPAPMLGTLPPTPADSSSAYTPPAPVAPAVGGLPVGIPEFVQVRENIATGLRPELDGLTWLKKNGFKTVIFLRGVKEDDTAARKVVESQGMAFKSMIVSPLTLTPEFSAEYNKLMSESATGPVFVYDTAGSVAGPVWYLWYRTSEKLNDQEARTNARRAGLREMGNAEQNSLMEAARLLAEKQ